MYNLAILSYFITMQYFFYYMVTVHNVCIYCAYMYIYFYISQKIERNAKQINENYFTLISFKLMKK